MKSYVFKVVVEPDQFEDGRKAFNAHCPELPGAITWGSTEAEALEKIKDAIQLVVEEMQEQGQSIPAEAIVESPAVLVTV